MKHLGLILDSRWLFDDHFQQLAPKVVAATSWVPPEEVREWREPALREGSTVDHFQEGRMVLISFSLSESNTRPCCKSWDDSP